MIKREVGHRHSQFNKNYDLLLAFQTLMFSRPRNYRLKERLDP